MTYYILDTETASLSGGVCEIAWLEIDNNLQVVSSFQSFINPERSIEPGAQAIHGISDSDVASSPTLKEVSAYLNTPIKLIAHNAQFDRRMIYHAIPVAGELCTLSLARRYIKGTENHKLSTLAAHLGLDASGAHSALADVNMVLGVLQHVLTLAGEPLEVLWQRATAPQVVHRMPFGKYKGQLTQSVPDDYKKWLLQQPGLDPNIRYTFTKMTGVK